MPRKINFADGFESSTEPVQGNITADNLSSYPDDASYEAVVQNSPEAGNIYYNTTSGKPRYYDSVASAWKDIDQDALNEIARLDLEQDVQDQDILQNSSDIVALDTKVDTDNAAQDILISQNVTNLAEKTLNSNQDRNLQVVGGGDITFNLSGGGSSSVVNTENTSQTTSTAISVTQNNGYTFTTGSAGLLTEIEHKMDNAFSSTGILKLELYNVDGLGFPTGPVVATSSPINLNTFEPAGTTTDVTFTFPTQPSLLASTKYAIVFTDSDQTITGSIFATKDGLQTYSGGELIKYNEGTLVWELDGEARDIYFVAKTLGNSTSGDLSWSQDILVQIPGTVQSTNTISAGSVNLSSSGEVAYIELNRDGSLSSVRPTVVADVSLVPLGDNTFIFARRVGDEVHVGNKDIIRISSGQVKKFSASNIEASSDLDKTLRTLSVGNISVTDNAGSLEVTNSDDIFIQSSNLQNDRNTISPQTIVFTDNNSVAYVDLNRDNDTTTALPVTVIDIDSLPIGNNILVIGRRFNDKIFFGYPETIVMEDGDTTRLDSRGSEPSAGSSRNLFRNGSFKINQLGTSFSVTAGTNPYTSDGWQTGGQVVSVLVDGDGSSAANTISLIKGGTATPNCTILHKIEKFEFDKYSVGDIVTVKFKMNNESVSVDVQGHVEFYSANSPDDFSAVTTETTYNDSQNVNVDGPTGVYSTVVATHVLTQNDIDNGMMIRLGGTSNSNTNIYTVNIKECHMYVNGGPDVKFETKGSTIAEEYNICQRYFQLISHVKSHMLDIGGSRRAICTQRLSIPMRTSPTVTTYDINSKTFGLPLASQAPGVYLSVPAALNIFVNVTSAQTLYVELDGFAATASLDVLFFANVSVPENNNRFFSLDARL